MDVVGIVKGLGTSPYHSKCCTYVGRPEKGQNKSNKKIPSSKNLAFYLGNQKIQKLFCLINNNPPEHMPRLQHRRLHKNNRLGNFHILRQPNVWQHVL